MVFKPRLLGILLYLNLRRVDYNLLVMILP